MRVDLREEGISWVSENEKFHKNFNPIDLKKKFVPFVFFFHKGEGIIWREEK